MKYLHEGKTRPMRITETQLRKLIRGCILAELDMGMMPGRQESTSTGSEMHRLLDNIDPIDLVLENWEDLSEACIEAIMSSGINRDSNVFYEGALEGSEDGAAGKEYNPDDNLRHGVMFQENIDYIMGYQWGHKNSLDWDGKEIPSSVMQDFIELQIQEYKDRTKTEVTKDMLFTAYDNVSPNRILRKAYYPIKDAYNDGGLTNAIKKGLPLAGAIATIETLDQVVIPLICIQFGLPPLTNAVGLGELVYPILLPKLGGKESIDFVKKYKQSSGNLELHDDI